MPIRTTLSFTQRHHDFMTKQVEEGIYATQSALVADAIENLIRQEEEREAALQAMADEIRRRAQAPREQFIEWTDENNPFTRVLEALRQRG